MKGSSVGQVVDTPAAADFMGEILARLDRYELSAMTRDLGEKSNVFRSILGASRPERPTEVELRRVLRACFPSRRRTDDILAQVGPEALADGMDDLLSGTDGLEIRIARFDLLLVDFPEVAVDLPWELLHLVQPERYWLWSRWMWNPRTDTGSLRLVTVDEVDLTADSRVAGYERVGEALAMVHDTARAIEFVDDGPFGTDVFLCCVYGIYMYTVLRMRMSQEFNRIVPELPSLTRRLLGIYHQEE